MTELPEGWVRTTIAEIADVQLGKMLDKVKNRGTPAAYLRNLNVRWGEFDLSDLLEMRFTEQEMDFFDIRDGDLILCEGGEPGRAAVWRHGVTHLKYQKALHRVRTQSGGSPDYLAHFLRHAADTDILTPLLTGTTIKHLPRTALLRLRLPLPPSAEQHRIVAKLDSLFARTRRAREELARIPRLIEHYKQAILAAAFRGDLTADWRQSRKCGTANRLVEDLPRELAESGVPATWQVFSIGEVMVNFDGKRVPVKAADRATRHGNYLYYGASGPIDTIDDYLFDGLYLLVGEDGANLISRATPIAFEVSGKFWVNNHAHVLQAGARTTTTWVKHFLNWINLEPYVTGSAQPKLTQRSLNRIALPLPPLDEQAEACRLLDGAFKSMSQMAHEHQLSINLLDHLDQANLAKAFRGELVPQDPNDEPAAELLARIRAARAARAAEPKPKRRGRKAAAD